MITPGSVMVDAKRSGRIAAKAMAGSSRNFQIGKTPEGFLDVWGGFSGGFMMDNFVCLKVAKSEFLSEKVVRPVRAQKGPWSCEGSSRGKLQDILKNRRGAAQGPASGGHFLNGVRLRRSEVGRHNRGAGQRRGSPSQMARRAQRAGREQGKGRPSSTARQRHLPEGGALSPPWMAARPSCVMKRQEAVEATARDGGARPHRVRHPHNLDPGRWDPDWCGHGFATPEQNFIAA
jgi:hypothetical protein